MRLSLLCRLVFVGVFTTLVGSGNAWASPITWQITGPIDQTFGGWNGVLPIGTPATLAVSWDPATANNPACGAGSGLYPAITAATLSFGSFSVPYSGGAIEVNAPSGNCTPGFGSGVVFHTFTSATPVGAPPAGLFELLATVFLADVNANNLAAILGPATQASVSVQAPGGVFRFIGNLEEQSFVQQVTAIPEPATAILFGSGMLAALKLRRRRT